VVRVDQSGPNRIMRSRRGGSNSWWEGGWVGGGGEIWGLVRGEKEVHPHLQKWDKTKEGKVNMETKVTILRIRRYPAGKNALSGKGVPISSASVNFHLTTPRSGCSLWRGVCCQQAREATCKFSKKGKMVTPTTKSMHKDPRRRSQNAHGERTETFLFRDQLKTLG